MGIHLYVANRSMAKRYFYCADGELLFIPQMGELLLRTECGQLQLRAGEIAVIPRGMKFAVDLLTDTARGYLAENYGAPLMLPERGPVGANGYANDRDFQYPRRQPTRTWKATSNCCASSPATSTAPPWTTPHWMWWPGPATPPPTNTTWRASM